MPRSIPDYEGLQTADAPVAPDGSQKEVAPVAQKETYFANTQKEVNYNNMYAPPPEWNVAEKAGAVYGGPYGGAYGAYAAQELDRSIQNGAPRRKWWARKRCAALCAVILVLVVIVITVPAVVVSRRATQMNTESPPNSESPVSAGTVTGSTTGAFQGTGIATNGAGFPTVVFFQHYDGPIWQTVANATDFVGPIIHGDIKNGTPLTVTTYNLGVDSYTHLAYIDSDNFLQDYLELNNSGSWSPGQLGAARVQASSSPHVGLSLTAARVGTNASHPAGVFPVGSIRLYYGGPDNRIHELTQLPNQTTWNETHTFPPTLRGDVGFVAGSPDNYTYVFGSDANGTLSWFYTQTFPENVGPWIAGTPSPVTVRNNGSVGLVANYLVLYQDDSDAVRAINFNANDLDAPWGTGYYIDQGYPGTRIAGTMVGKNNIPGILMQNEGDSMSWHVEFGNDIGNTTVAVNM